MILHASSIWYINLSAQNYYGRGILAHEVGRLERPHLASAKTYIPCLTDNYPSVNPDCVHRSRHLVTTRWLNGEEKENPETPRGRRAGRLVRHVRVCDDFLRSILHLFHYHEPSTTKYVDQQESVIVGVVQDQEQDIIRHVYLLTRH